MSEKRRIPLAQAEELAAELVSLLSPSCDRISVAGSIRRRRPEVGDVELVAIPLVIERERPTGLFESEIVREDQLAVSCETLFDRKDQYGRQIWTKRLDSNGRHAWGPLHKRATWRGFAVDLFCATPANWGWILLLRTGSREFNQRLVTERRKGGCMPEWLQSKGGMLMSSGQLVPTPTEESVFLALGLEFVPPELRTEIWRPSRVGAAW